MSNAGSKSFLTTIQAAEYLNLSKSYLDKLRLSGEGPAFTKMGQRAIRYRIEDLDAWARSRTMGSTSQAA